MDENIVDPTAPVVEATVIDESQPSLYSRITTKYPRATRAVKLTAAGLGIVAVTRAVTNAQHNKDKLDEAKLHALEAGDALSDAVTVPDTTDA